MLTQLGIGASPLGRGLSSGDHPATRTGCNKYERHVLADDDHHPARAYNVLGGNAISCHLEGRIIEV